MSHRVKTIAAIVVLGFVLGAVAPHAAWSITAFARKEGVACDMCHTTIPRLNEYGYRYRKAGFRDPAEIGNDISGFNFADVLSARVQARFDVHYTDMGSNQTTTTNQLTLHEITLYPASGSFGRHYGSLFEMSAANEDFLELENAYLRWTWGDENQWYTVRFGIFHPFEGYGASDRPYSLSRPFIQTKTANNGQGSTFFHLWGFDEAGVEAAWVRDHTTVSLTLFNGIFVTNDEGNYKAFPAAGGHLQKAAGFRNSDSKDVQVFVNQAIDENGSGVSLYYYYGQMDLPMPGVAPMNFDPTSSFENDFHRVAGYASFVASPQVELQAGFGWGRDNFVADTLGTIDNFNSQGAFGEVDFHPTDITAVGGRFDWFDPSTDVDNNEMWGATAFVNVPLNDGFQLIFQYQHTQTKRGSLDDLKNDTAQIRMIWIQ